MPMLQTSSGKSARPRMTSRISLSMLAAVMGAVLATPVAAQKVNRAEGDLSAAGFTVRAADTAARQDMLARLPKKKLITRTRAGVTHYVYADPKGCNCLYVGSEQAFQTYNQQRQTQQIADQRQETAEAYSDPLWNRGAWGDGFGSGWNYGGGFGW